jgi:hypothetical protein
METMLEEGDERKQKDEEEEGNAYLFSQTIQWYFHMVTQTSVLTDRLTEMHLKVHRSFPKESKIS